MLPSSFLILITVLGVFPNQYIEIGLIFFLNGSMVAQVAHSFNNMLIRYRVPGISLNQGPGSYSPRAESGPKHVLIKLYWHAAMPTLFYLSTAAFQGQR